MSGEVSMRGGAREGAGRKPRQKEAARTTLSFVCTPAEKKLIDELTENSGLSRSQFIMSAINYFYEKELKH